MERLAYSDSVDQGPSRAGPFSGCFPASRGTRRRTAQRPPEPGDCGPIPRRVPISAMTRARSGSIPWRLPQSLRQRAARAWASLCAGPSPAGGLGELRHVQLGLISRLNIKLLVCCLRIFPAFAVPPPETTTEGTSSPLQQPRGLQRLQSLSGSVGCRRELGDDHSRTALDIT